MASPILGLTINPEKPQNLCGLIPDPLPPSPAPLGRCSMATSPLLCCLGGRRTNPEVFCIIIPLVTVVERPVQKTLGKLIRLLLGVNANVSKYVASLSLSNTISLKVLKTGILNSITQIYPLRLWTKRRPASRCC